MVSEIIENLGGVPVVAILMNEKIKNIRNWNDRERVPVKRRLEFIDMCKRHQIKVTMKQLGVGVQ